MIGLGGEYRVKGSGGFGEIRGHGGMECGHPIICYLSIGLFRSTIFFCWERSISIQLICPLLRL